VESRPKKVLFVITKATWGGAQRYVYDLASHLPPQRFAASVAFGAPGRLAEMIRAQGIPAHHIPALGRDVSPARDLASFFQTLSLLKREHPDVVHLNSSKAGMLGALAARLAGIRRIVFTAHGWPYAERRSATWRSMAWLGSWVTALLSDAVICVSKADLSLGSRLPFCAHKMHLIYNGIEPEVLGSGEMIRAAFPAGVKILGTIGELTENKNHIALIEEAKKRQLTYVAIVGEGELREYLEQKIHEYHLEDSVKLFGFLPAREVLRGFDAFALPSLKEGLPYVLIEAKAAGLPIVANRVGGVGEIIDAKDLSEFSLEQMLRQTAALY
jgi:glycosyltransferase involved in cell wall biosynthesis